MQLLFHAIQYLVEFIKKSPMEAQVSCVHGLSNIQVSHLTRVCVCVWAISLSVVHLMVSFSLVFMYGLMISAIFKSQNAVLQVNSKETVKQVLKTLLLLNMPHVFSWLTSDALHAALSLSSESHAQILLWTTVTITPVGSVVSPIFFLVTRKVTTQSWKKKAKPVFTNASS